MPRTAEQFWDDLALRHAILLYRLEAREARRIERILLDAFDELAARTQIRMQRGFSARGPNSIWEKSKALRDLVEQADGSLKTAYGSALAQARRALEEAAAYESAWSSRTLDRVMPADFGIRAVSLPLLRSIAYSRPFQGAILKDWWATLERDSRTVYKRAVQRGLVLGESNAAIANRVAEALHIRARHAEAVTRTAVRHVTAAARMATYLENSHVVKGVVWVSTLDARTTKICIGLDGKRFPLDSGPRPPAHFNCRSDIAPVLEAPERFGLRSPTVRLERAARDYQLDASSLPREPRARRRAIMRAAMRSTVDRGTTYADWLRRQPLAVQNEVLGPTRAALWRSGRVQIDRFVGSDLKPLTLEELARREGFNLREVLAGLR